MNVKMPVIGVILVMGSLLLINEDGSARRDILTAEQQSILQSTQEISIQAIALTENGQVDPDALYQVVAEQLLSIGFGIGQAKTGLQQVILKVKCEEKKRWLRTSQTDQDRTLAGTPSRTWTGPACHLTYFIDDQKGPWEYEIRTPFEDAWTAAQKASTNDSGHYALTHLQQALRESDFPLVLAAEWKQSERLAPLLLSPTTPPEKKRQIIALAHKVVSSSMMDALETMISQEDLAPEATRALGHMGPKAIPILIDLLKHNPSVPIRVAAAEALGTLGPQTQSGDSQIVPTLITLLENPDLDLKVQTEIVRTLGKIPNQQSVAPLKKVGLKAWTSRSPDPQMQELRETVDWSLWQINPSAHTEDG